ncbi:MAG: hypothetical protein IKS49_06745 [Actinomycetaceae bacterium]|nr:hypothetical protein [Actinomycetaceae bacterium]
MAHTARKILTTLAAAVAITAVTPAAVEAYDANISETATVASVEGPVVVSSDCVGGQDEIDTCVGATYYAPVADYLGVPYYAQHNGKGGEAWLSLEVGDEVIVDGVSYTVDTIRTVSTGGDLEQIAGMGGAAYLQTCLDDAIHSNVYALTQN